MTSPLFLYVELPWSSLIMLRFQKVDECMLAFQEGITHLECEGSKN